ncbi:MAG: hypothetical protein P8L73_01580 [SAR86 cluster bacterium]|nr:hypothetical protein [SAR86 cluster bacterium]
MLEGLFEELKSLLLGVGITSAAMLILLLLPKKVSLKLGEYPVILAILFLGLVMLLIKIFS